MLGPIARVGAVCAFTCLIGKKGGPGAVLFRRRPYPHSFENPHNAARTAPEQQLDVGRPSCARAPAQTPGGGAFGTLPGAAPSGAWLSTKFEGGDEGWREVGPAFVTQPAWCIIISFARDGSDVDLREAARTRGGCR